VARILVAGLAAGLVALAIASSAGPAGASAPAAASPTRPNILFVLTDDMAVGDLQYMPHTTALVADEGATFQRYFVNSSLCCPSRTTTLRGQYEHNTGVVSNGGTNGGFQKAYATGIERDTIATHLQRAGYRTGLFGKYLNGYPETAPIDYVPPGWTDWASAVRGNPYGEYGYTLNQNHVLHTYGGAPSDYGTRVYVHLAEHFVRASAHRHQPFFAYLAVYAPHQPATPAPQDVGKFPTAQVPRTTSFDQADVSRSPRYVRDLPPLSPTEAAAIDSLYRLRLESLQAVDRGMVSLVHTLRATHQLDNTYIVFASDNGFHLGQHRLPAGKQTPYDTDIRVPLLVRGPGIPAGREVPQLSGNVDLSPTFASMAHIRPPAFSDGRSLLSLARGTPGVGADWRQAYLIEHRPETSAPTAGAVDRQPAPLEPRDPDQALIPTVGPVLPHEVRDQQMLDRRAHIPAYDGVRTDRYLYVEYATGERELYDVTHDPEEIHNLAGEPRDRPVQESLARTLTGLRDCAGRGCRIAESRSAA
jgi:arylsulfatase A-like enzyme